ncbi:PAS domain-containing protein [Burkholderiaceae bacterium DAT-1]|nr:PAS domain-containing protein [Burkholderiaceae bacterium DAT-1]
MNFLETREQSRSAAADSFWRSAALLNVFRILLGLGLLFTSLFVSKEVLRNLHLERTFTSICILYLVFSVMAAATLRRRMVQFQLLLTVQMSVDTLFVVMLMHLAGGIHTGIGLLLPPLLAAAAIISRGRTAVFNASVAAIALLLEQGYRVIFQDAPSSDFFQVGMLALACMAMATLAYRLAQYATESQILAEKRGHDLANLAEINQFVIQDVSDGVLVVDSEHVIRQFNQQAERLLGPGMLANGIPLRRVAPTVIEALEGWQRGDSTLAITPVPSTRQTVRPRFVPVGQGAGLIVFLEDIGKIHREAEQIKLAAMGRLTANIAHEIRNPLSAISHAAQLLGEDDADAATRRLTRIIQENVARLDGLVRSVLDLSRRDRRTPVRVILHDWLERFLAEFREFEHIDVSIALECPVLAQMSFDPQQLQQVMWNLCRNAWRYSHRLEGSVRIVVTSSESGWMLDVIDDGAGVPSDLIPQLFEPFFTTDAKGTGLGLYIARELCAANEATLEYVPQSSGACFRIHFGTDYS